MAYSNFYLGLLTLEYICSDEMEKRRKKKAGI